MRQDLSWPHVLSLIGVVIWTFASVVVSFGFTVAMIWGRPTVLHNSALTQLPIWAVVTAPALGVVAAFVLAKTLRKHSMTALATALAVQLIALFTLMPVS